MTGIFLQVRLDSSRLPGKALLDLGGRTVVEHAMDSLAQVQVDIHAVLTDDTSAAALRLFAPACGFSLFRGPRDDVLHRYAMAAREYGVDTLVRATGDNPLVSTEVAELTLQRYRASGADYVALSGAPLGTGVEVFSADALFEADAEAGDPTEREHVTAFIYRRPERYRVLREPVPLEWQVPDTVKGSAWSVTLDTPDDYAQLRRIYDDVYRETPIRITQLVEWLRTHT